MTASWLLSSARSTPATRFTTPIGIGRSGLVARLQAHIESWVVARWYGVPGALVLLRPLQWLYEQIALRRARRAKEFASAHPLAAPVVVVGNIVAGGTGKTPVVHWLVEQLQAQGERPGVVTRGYGGSAACWPRFVHAGSDPLINGDEAVELAGLCGVPVMAGPDRHAAARSLLEFFDCTVVVSDDGLQHYRLPRDLELALVDAQRGLGNGELLPVGPLRERAERLNAAELVLVTGAKPADDAEQITNLPLLSVPVLNCQLAVTRAEPLLGGHAVAANEAPFAGQPCVALSAIGNPGRFHADLHSLGCVLEVRAFADHHGYAGLQPDWSADALVVTTGKDAVKLLSLYQHNPPQWLQNVWILRRQVRFADADQQQLEQQLRTLFAPAALTERESAH